MNAKPIESKFVAMGGHAAFLDQAKLAVALLARWRHRPLFQQQAIPMNTKHEPPPEAPEQCLSISTQNADTNQPVVVAQERLHGETSEPPPANRPSLLDSFYHWLMSRS